MPKTAPQRTTQRKLARKTTQEEIWKDETWRVCRGKLVRRKGNPGIIQSLFKVVAEKLPFASIDSVKLHEREVETLLIRAGGPHLHFNKQKKRVDVEAGNVRDFAPGSIFYERQKKFGPRSKNRR